MHVLGDLKDKPGVYTIRSKSTDMIYVGGSLSVKRRQKKHAWNLRSHSRTNKMLALLYDAFGEDDFEFTPFYCKESQVGKWEQALLEQVPVPLRMNVGACTGSPFRNLKHSAESRKKISAALIGREITQEARRLTSEALKGRLVSKATRKKLSDAGKRRRHSSEARRKMSLAKSKPVESFNLDTETLIEKFPSASAAAVEIGGSQSLISAVCRGKARSHKGVGWRFCR